MEMIQKERGGNEEKRERELRRDREIGDLEGNLRSFGVKTLAADEKQRCWGSFCSSSAPESEYVGHSRTHWPMFGFSHFKGIFAGKMRFFAV